MKNPRARRPRAARHGRGHGDGRRAERHHRGALRKRRLGTSAPWRPSRRCASSGPEGEPSGSRAGLIDQPRIAHAAEGHEHEVAAGCNAVGPAAAASSLRANSRAAPARGGPDRARPDTTPPRDARKRVGAAGSYGRRRPRVGGEGAEQRDVAMGVEQAPETHGGTSRAGRHRAGGDDGDRSAGCRWRAAPPVACARALAACGEIAGAGVACEAPPQPPSGTLAAPAHSAAEATTASAVTDPRRRGSRHVAGGVARASAHPGGLWRRLNDPSLQAHDRADGRAAGGGVRAAGPALQSDDAQFAVDQRVRLAERADCTPRAA